MAGEQLAQEQPVVRGVARGGRGQPLEIDPVGGALVRRAQLAGDPGQEGHRPAGAGLALVQAVQEQVASIWMATNGYLENVPVEDVRAFEAAYLEYMRSAGASVLQRIVSEKWDDPIIADLKKVTDDFKAGSTWAASPTAGRVAAS